MRVLKRECIGETHNAQSANGCKFRITIKDDPSEFDLYERLGLKVFRYVNAKPLKPIQKNPEDMTWPELKAYAKKKGIPGKTKQEILNGLNSTDEK